MNGDTLGPGNAIWGDGEWIGWNEINELIYLEEQKAEFPKASVDLIRAFDLLVDAAREYKYVTGRYLPVFGEMGELFAEMQYGIVRHRPNAQGSDGRLGNDFVEVKTITPEKGRNKVCVKRSGNFSKLVIVKISADFEFEARMIDRRSLKKGSGKLVNVSWTSSPKKDNE